MGSDFFIWLENALAVSSDGVLWAGTFGGGVSRFDGETWTTHTTEDGLYADSVTAVAIAPNGDLWCASQGEGPGSGISHFNGKTWTVYTASDMGVSSGHFMNVAFDPDGTLFWYNERDLPLPTHGWELEKYTKAHAGHLTRRIFTIWKIPRKRKLHDSGKGMRLDLDCLPAFRRKALVI